jgi:hypothetical protein
MLAETELEIPALRVAAPTSGVWTFFRWRRLFTFGQDQIVTDYFTTTSGSDLGTGLNADSGIK